MSLLSGIRVVEQTPERLVVVDPPYYLLGGFFLLFGLALSVFALPSKQQGQSQQGFDWLALALASPFLLVGWYFLASKATLVVSRETGRMSVVRSYFGFPVRQHEGPLEEARYANVETGKGTRRVVVVLRSGKVVAVGGLTDRKGHYQAAEAINAFLSGRSVQ